MPISSRIIKPAVSNIITGAKNALGIASGSYPSGTDSESTRYLALLLFGYEAVDKIPDAATAAHAMQWVYGSGGVKGLKDIPSTPPLFLGPTTFHDTDAIKVLESVFTALESIAVPTLKDRTDFCASDAASNLLDTMNPPKEWLLPHSPESIFASNLLSSSARCIYPFLAVRLLGFLPDNCRWVGYKGLADSAIATAEAVLGAGHPAISRTASFLVQCGTLKQLNANGAYQYIPLDEPAKAIAKETMDSFRSFMSSGATADVEKMKAYLENGYNNMDFGSIADAWNVVEPAAATAQADPAAPAAETEPAAAGHMASGTPAPESSEPPVPAAPTNRNAMPGGLDRRSFTLLQRMAVDEDQLIQALEKITSGQYYGIPFLTTYQPGITEKAIIKLLDTQTDKASHKKLTGADADPRERKTIMIPPAFKVDQSQTIWTKAVVTDLGFPFINFTSPPIMELIRGTDPKSIKMAYKQVKGMFKRCGLKKPIDTLKAFAHSQYRNCALNSLVVDADSIFYAEPGQGMTVSIVDPYNPKLHTKGSFNLPVDFATAFYGVLSPVKAIKQYAELCGMSQEEYMDYLSDHGKPPVYVLTPKRAAFKRGPKGGILHELFSSKVKPILVRSRIGNHDGGFMIPERIADLLFSV